MKYNSVIQLGSKQVSFTEPTVFIADIAANHDGDLERAKELIWLAKEAGADIAKFQHFTANKIVSDYGFRNLKEIKTHQNEWTRSVYDTYDQYHTKREWNESLEKTCRDAEIQFMTTPYDSEAVTMFSSLIPAFKVGSGDITFKKFIEEIAVSKKPVILATGAATMNETIAATDLVLKHNKDLILLQCNTNYTGDIDNFNYVNLNVLKAYATKWPGLILGLSDHTPGHSAVLGAVSLGARVIEKHFTDDNKRDGPDHKFALNPITWRAMVDSTRELELALGDGVKRIERNEQEAVIVQRRAMRAKRDLLAETVIRDIDFEALRPCPVDAISPFEFPAVMGRKIKSNLQKGDYISWDNLN